MGQKFRLFILLSIFLCFCLPAKSQVPGYLGKRGFFGYNFYSSPSFLKPVTNRSLQVTKLNIQHELHFEFITGKKSSIGILGQYSKTGVRVYETILFEYLSGNTFNKERLTINTYGNLKLMNTGIFFKLYPGKVIAPLGMYFRTDFLITIASYQFEKKDFLFYPDSNTTNPLYINKEPLTGKIYLPGLRLAIGKQWGVGKSILVNLGTQVSLLPIAANDFKVGVVKEPIERNIKIRNYYHQNFLVVLGLSYLAF